MNIFFLDACPRKSAQYQIDRHVVKMPSECCIMMANAYPLSELEKAPKTQKGNVRGHGYSHHGCTKWAISSIENFNWLLEHARALCDEYTFRTGKIHFCEYFINWCKNNPPLLKSGVTPPFLAMPDEYKSCDVIKSYRKYYIEKKTTDKNGKNMFVFSRRGTPEIFLES